MNSHTTDSSNLIGRRFADAGRTFEVLHWSPRRPGHCEVRVLSAPSGDYAADTIGWKSVRDVLAARPARRSRSN